MALRVRELFVYPLKSGAGVRVATATLDALGFVGDRRWMVVDADGAFLSQRRLPPMALIQATSLDDDLYLSAPDRPSLMVQRPGRGARERVVEIWDDHAHALDGGDEAAEWLSAVLECSVRLVYCPPGRARIVDQKYASPDDRVGFADGFPLLIVGDASLRHLNAQLRERGETPVGIERFRPNIVIEGAGPYAEDGWRQIRIGTGSESVVIDIVKPCARCSTIAVDPRTGKQGVEPTRTLATYRRRGEKIYFAQNALPQTQGTIVTGAEVQVIA